MGGKIEVSGGVEGTSFTGLSLPVDAALTGGSLREAPPGHVPGDDAGPPRHVRLLGPKPADPDSSGKPAVRKTVGVVSPSPKPKSSPANPSASSNPNGGANGDPGSTAGGAPPTLVPVATDEPQVPLPPGQAAFDLTPQPINMWGRSAVPGAPAHGHGGRACPVARSW